MYFKRYYIYINFAATVFLYVNGNPISNEIESGACTLPIYPPKGKWTFIEGADGNPGSKVPFNTIITFSCDEQYKLSNNYNTIICLGRNWSQPPPQCILAEARSKRRKRGEEIKGEVVGIGGDGGDAHADAQERDRRGEGRGEGRGSAVGGRGGDGVVLGEATGIVSGKLYGKGGRGGEGRAGRPGGRGEGVGGRGGDGLVVGTRRRRDVEEDDKESHQVKRQLFGSIFGYGEDANGSSGGRGGDGIVIGSGGRKTVIGSGEEGSSNYDQSGVARGGQGGIGNIKGGKGTGGTGSQSGSGYSGNTGQRGSGGQTFYEGGRRGQDGLVIGNGETVNGYAIGIGQPGGNGGKTGGRGGDGAVINEGGRVNGVLVGIGGQGGNSGSPSSNKKKGQQGGQGGSGQVGSGQVGSGQVGSGQVGYGQNGYGYDYEQEGTYSGGQNTDLRGGRGGDGVVIRGGVIGGTVVGVGGQGGSGGYYRRKRETYGQKVKTTLPEEEKGHTKLKNQEDQVRNKRQSRLKSITTTQHVYVMVIKDGKTYLASSHQGNHDGWNGQGGSSIGGTGGSGISLLNNPELEGILIGFGGQGAPTYIKRTRREVGEENQEEREIIAKGQDGEERIKRQATITGVTYPGQPILVGGRGGDGVIIDGGVIQGVVVGYGGPGGNPKQGR